MSRGSRFRNRERSHADLSLAVSARREEFLEGLLGSGGPFWFLVLDCVQDPHNLGASMRTADADDSAGKSIYEVDLRTGSLAMVLGAEGEGLRRLTREKRDFLVRIPMDGHVERLNVSVATGVCLFEAVRQRGDWGTESRAVFCEEQPENEETLDPRVSALCGPRHRADTLATAAPRASFAEPCRRGVAP